MKIQILITAVVLALSGAAFAQTTPSTATPKLDKALVNDQKRIDAGVQSGQLTSPETANLEKRKDKLAADEAAAKANGTVTPNERRKLLREQKHLDKKIYDKKHNGRTAN